MPNFSLNYFIFLHCCNSQVREYVTVHAAQSVNFPMMFLFFPQRIEFLQGQDFTIDGEITLAPVKPQSGVKIVQERGLLVRGFVFIATKLNH